MHRHAEATAPTTTDTPMRDTEVFIISWPAAGVEENAVHIATVLAARGARVNVIYSTTDEQPRSGPGNWIQVANETFYGMKFNEILKHTRGSRLLQIHADARHGDWPSVLKRFDDHCDANRHAGVWAPDVDYTYFKTSDVLIAEGPDAMAFVAQTDGIILGLTQPVIQRLKQFNYSENALGWCIDWAAICCAYVNNLTVVRDLSATVVHPRGSGYGHQEAARQAGTFLKQMTPQEQIAFRVLSGFIAHQRARHRHAKPPVPHTSDLAPVPINARSRAVTKMPELSHVPAWKLLDDETGTQVSNPYAIHARPEIDSLFRHAPNRIIDIGCSTGSVGHRLKQQLPGLFVWGVEIGASAAEAEKRLDKVSRKLLTEFTEEEVSLLSTMDTVLLLDVLEHLYDPWRMLCFLAQHLKPNAQIIVSLPNIGHVNVLRDLSNDFWHYRDCGLLDITHVRFFTHYEMRRMFYETGFRILKTSFRASKINKQFSTNDFPMWMDFENIKIKVKSYEEYIALNSRQIMFNLKVAGADELSEAETSFRRNPHPDSLA